MKSINKSALAKKYGISLRTLNNWLSQIPELGDINKVRIFTPKQINTIYRHLGEP